MALTKAHFAKHISLEPLSEVEVTRSKKKITKLLRAENYFYEKYATHKVTTPSPVHKKTLKPVFQGQHNCTHIRSKTYPQSSKTVTLDDANNASYDRASNFVKWNDPAILTLKTQQMDRSSLKVRSMEASHVKKVTFTLPPTETSAQIFSHSSKKTNDLFTDKSHIFPSIPTNSYRITKQDHITSPPLNNPLCPISNDTCSNDKRNNKRQQCHNIPNGHLSEASSYKRRSLAQRVQTRRGKGYLIRHKFPKLSEASRDVTSPKQPSPNLTLQKARNILLQKMQNLPKITNQNLNPRRLIILPSLAAPCSEEFAVAMRRTYGSKFISSPNILDHVVKRNVPYQATAMLLDAIVRPPSTPSYNR